MKKLLSVTLLVCTLAFSSAALAHSGQYGKEWQNEMPGGMDKALSKLPADKAAEFRQTMKEAHEENKDLQDQAYKLHGDIHAILTAPTFDKHAFLAKRTKLQKLHEEMEENRSDAFASAFSGLSQKERITMIRTLDHERNPKQHKAQTQSGNGSANKRDASIQH